MAPLTLKACFILQPGVLKPPYYHILIYIVTYYSYYSICHMCCLNSDVSQKEALKDSEFSIQCKKDELTRVIVITYYYIKSLAPGDRKSVLKLPGGLSPSKTQPSPPTNFHRRLIQHPSRSWLLCWWEARGCDVGEKTSPFLPPPNPDLV